MIHCLCVIGISISQGSRGPEVRIIFVLDIGNKCCNRQTRGMDAFAITKIEKQVEARSMFKNLVRHVNLDDREVVEPFMISQPSFGLWSNENYYFTRPQAG